MLVSFIIPAYNAADTIVRCLESIYGLSLTRDEFEVIVIDDCSKDETVTIVDNFKLQVSNLILLKQAENHRQGAARNRGVKEAKGEYICFVDADDAVTEGIVTAIHLAKEKQMDMVALHNANVNEHGVTILEIQKMDDLEGKEFSGIEMQNTYPYWCSAPWGYIYSKDYLQRVHYPFVEDVLFEDSDFVVVHLYHAKHMAYSPELAYKAYYREGSTTHHTSYKNVADYLLLGERMLRFFETIDDRWIDDRSTQFAESILEGACWNIQKSCKRMIKLSSIEEVRSYYNRIDANVNRQDMLADKQLRKYYWNTWTSLCVGHRKLATIMLAVLLPMYKFVKG